MLFLCMLWILFLFFLVQFLIVQARKMCGNHALASMIVFDFYDNIAVIWWKTSKRNRHQVNLFRILYFFFLQKRTINQLILLIWIQYFTINERNESYWWQCTHLKIVQRNWILIHSYVGFELLFFVRQIVLKVYLSYFGYWCHSEQQSQW